MDSFGKAASQVVSREGILGGMPVVEGTRVPAETLLAEIPAGSDRVEIFRHHPSLPLDGIEAIAWESAVRP